MFNQQLLSCRGSALQAAARGRAVPGCGAHMNIQWLPSAKRVALMAFLTNTHRYSIKYSLDT